jgi:hypothetical protein
MPITFPFKDPDEYLDYVLDWTARLGTDTIASSIWTTPTPTGLTLATATLASFTTTVWLGGGTIGDSYSFTNRIETVAGRIMDQSVKIKIKAK